MSKWERSCKYTNILSTERADIKEREFIGRESRERRFCKITSAHHKSAGKKKDMA